MNRIRIWRDERSSDLIGSGGAGRSDWLRALIRTHTVMQGVLDLFCFYVLNRSFLYIHAPAHAGTGSYARQNSIKRPVEINLSRHFLQLCFELTWIEISHDRVEGHLTNAS